MTDDERFMSLALREAERGVGLTSPNPAVGAVIVRDGRVIGQGYHHRAGQPHAEIEALRSLRSPAAAQGATIYVTLEPCSTHGRTPPCVEAILAAGLSRVVVGAVDPNPAHAGHGLEVLRDRGVQVTAGILADQCTALNRPFNKWITTRQPWVIAKAGLSLDGRLTRPPGEGQWLTSPAARRDAQRLRWRADAIIVGANTFRADNPRLTIRDLPRATEKPQPWRVVMTTGQRPLPEDHHLFTDEHRARTIISRRQTLAETLTGLARERQVTCVLLEGGGRLLGEAFDHRLVDEVCFYLAPVLCGGPVVAVGGQGVAEPGDAPPLREVTYRKVGPDLCLHGLV